MEYFRLLAEAGLFVKGVFLILILFSIVSWSIVVEKLWKVLVLFYCNKKVKRISKSGASLEEMLKYISKHGNPLYKDLIISGLTEYRHTKNNFMGEIAGMDPRSRILERSELVITRYNNEYNKGVIFLSITASAAPFIGLLGTVWGIMNSFQAIAVSKSQSLAVVAPGITEALFITAIGLVVAIPASIFYNFFTSVISSLFEQTWLFASDFADILSRNQQNNNS